MLVQLSAATSACQGIYLMDLFDVGNTNHTDRPQQPCCRNLILPVKGSICLSRGLLIVSMAPLPRTRSELMDTARLPGNSTRGDLLIWHHWCVHASSTNTSDRVRQAIITFYITRFHTTAFGDEQRLRTYRASIRCACQHRLKPSRLPLPAAVLPLPQTHHPCAWPCCRHRHRCSQPDRTTPYPLASPSRRPPPHRPSPLTAASRAATVRAPHKQHRTQAHRSPPQS